jgi:hypothetical protein
MNNYREQFEKLYHKEALPYIHCKNPYESRTVYDFDYGKYLEHRLEETEGQLKIATTQVEELIRKIK